ncbi:bifunctional metallophosphatase/5'-nucleotidase [Allochromatium vinosum]|uniref:5'-nucleotidase n=1 Tax=Allochromatium vinosum (strain ATCC 17899 / DSM 180 / NBRC 103801 / NCIMB 10441 / D) TaxID=572477 RepID=D3RVM4_ALLVD|nr:5'-nucleotidase C-terminal domain-containing protein [Allochromatium vinosum]ADC61151.1 5'-nucleotidase [Allochromatium vinosum DSM 180]
MVRFAFSTRLAVAMLVGLAFVVSGGHSAAVETGTDAFRLTILHINDHHSHLEPALDARLAFAEPVGAIEVELGGFARVSAKIRELRARYPNSLALHAGDAITGTLYYTLFKGEADAAAMNRICFDAYALGNHEFDDGDAGLAGFLRMLDGDPAGCRTPVLAANVVPALGTPLYPRAGERLIQPDVVRTVAGRRIGIIGLDISGKTRRSSRPLDSTVFLDELTTAQQRIDALTSQGIDKIILLTHRQYLNDLDMALHLRGVDAIIGGDSHTLLGESFADWGLNPSGPYPTETHDPDGNRVCVVQAWQYASVVGELHLSFDAAGHVARCEGTPHLLLGERFARDGQPLDATARQTVLDAIAAAPELGIVEPDPSTQALITRYSEQVGRLKQTIVGIAVQDLCLERVPGQGLSALCDARATQAHGGDIQQLVTAAYLARVPEADVAIQNAGGARIDIPAGPISVSDVYSLLPFANTLVALRLTGTEIRAALEEAVAGFMDHADGSGGAYPVAANLRWELDLSRPRGQRFSHLEIRRRGAPAWRPLEETDEVVVVTNSFLAGSGDGYETFKRASEDGRASDTFIDYAQGFIDYLQQDLGGAAPGDPILATPPEIRPLPCADYSTQRFVDGQGRLLQPDPANPPACR